MAVVCQRIVSLLELCTDMIDIRLTFHMMPNTSHLELTPYICTVNMLFLIWDTLKVQKNINLHGCGAVWGGVWVGAWWTPLVHGLLI